MSVNNQVPAAPDEAKKRKLQRNILIAVFGAVFLLGIFFFKYFGDQPQRTTEERTNDYVQLSERPAAGGRGTVSFTKEDLGDTYTMKITKENAVGYEFSLIVYYHVIYEGEKPIGMIRTYGEGDENNKDWLGVNTIPEVDLQKELLFENKTLTYYGTVIERPEFEMDALSMIQTGSTGDELIEQVRKQYEEEKKINELFDQCRVLDISGTEPEPHEVETGYTVNFYLKYGGIALIIIAAIAGYFLIWKKKSA